MKFRIIYLCQVIYTIYSGGMILLSAWSNFPLSLNATETPEEPKEILKLDIHDAAELARERAEAVLAAQAAVEAKEKDGRADLAFAYPQLIINTNYTRNEELSTIPFGPFGEIETGRKNDYRGSVHADQLIWSFGKLSATRDQADANIAVALAELAIASRDAAHIARVAVTRFLLAHARHQVSQERVSQRHDELEDAKDLRQVGIVTDLDVRQASINLIRAKDQLQTIEANLKQGHLDVAAALALAPEAFLITGKLVRPQGVSSLISTVKDQLDQGSEITRLLARYEAQSAEKRNLRAESLPELRAVAEGSKDGDDLDNLEDAWSAGISLTWDLYSGGDRKARKAAATSRMYELQLRREELIRERQKQFKKLEIELNVLDQRIANEKEAVDLAAANYSDARDQYRAGLITLTRLGEISLAVAEARFRYVSLVNDEQTAVNELLRLLE